MCNRLDLKTKELLCACAYVHLSMFFVHVDFVFICFRENCGWTCQLYLVFSRLLWLIFLATQRNEWPVSWQFFFLQARESFVITTGIDTKLGSAPKSKVGISRTKDLAVFLRTIETIGKKVTGFMVVGCTALG